MNQLTDCDTTKLARTEILPNAIYLTAEAASLLGVRPSTIRAFVRQGKLRGKGRPYRFRGSELFKVA